MNDPKRSPCEPLCEPRMGIVDVVMLSVIARLTNCLQPSKHEQRIVHLYSEYYGDRFKCRKSQVTPRRRRKNSTQDKGGGKRKKAVVAP
jgi:hypothetical protein